MALQIICDNVQEDEKTGVYTGYFYVIDDAAPNVRLKETAVQGRSQAEIQTALQLKYSAWKATYDREQQLIDIGNTVAQAVMTAVDGAS